MKKWILLFLIGALAQGANGQVNGPATDRGPMITFQNLEHDYGTIENGANGNCEFTYANTGDAPLIVASCRSSCGCLVPRCDTTPLAPGKSQVVQLKYDTKRTGPINKSVTVQSNANNMPIVVLRIKGNVLPVPKELVPQNAPTNSER